MKRTAKINKIIPFSNVDGPSNRMAIFFQACPFDCLFCHNPETIHHCIHCGECINTCPTGALYIKDHQVIWDRNNCIQCDTCIRICPHDASPKIIEMTTVDLLKEIQKAAPYISGITTSGGECTLYHDYLLELFPLVKDLGLSVLIDTNGSFDFTQDSRLLDCIDGVMLDIKAINREWSDSLIRYPNDIVLKNLDYLLKKNKLYEVRTVIFPNHDQENKETIQFVAKHIQDKCDYKIIRYRPFGVRDKYQKIIGDITTDEEYAKDCVEFAKEHGASKAYYL